MIMIVKTPGSQMGSPAAAEEGGEEMGGEKCESVERSEVQARSTVARSSCWSLCPLGVGMSLTFSLQLVSPSILLLHCSI